MNDTPRMVQGQIDPITSQGVLKHFVSQPDDRDAVIVDLQRRLDERDAILDQYNKLLLEIKDAANLLSETLTMVGDSLRAKKENPVSSESESAG